MIFGDREYDGDEFESPSSSAMVMVQNWTEMDYSVVNVQCSDRARLLFGVICTLVDMDYVVFHAAINSTTYRTFVVSDFFSSYIFLTLAIMSFFRPGSVKN